MPRSIWNGTISFGLITVPVKVHSAHQDHSVRFHQVHAADGARIAHKRICSKDGNEVPAKQLAKGYEVSDGEYVVLSADEIAAAGGDGAHRIALDEFVPASEIDPDYFARTYYLGAGDNGRPAYRLLHDALAKTGRAGLGRWVFHNREYLVAVRARDALLLLHTMRFADELVAPDELDIDSPSRAPNRREAEMAAALLDSLHGAFKPEAFSDTYRDELLALIKRKAKGDEIEIPQATEPEAAPDLMAALEASLEGRTSTRRSTSTKSSTSKKTSKSSPSKKPSKSGKSTRSSKTSETSETSKSAKSAKPAKSGESSRATKPSECKSSESRTRN